MHEDVRQRRVPFGSRDADRQRAARGVRCQRIGGLRIAHVMDLVQWNHGLGERSPCRAEIRVESNRISKVRFGREETVPRALGHGVLAAEKRVVRLRIGRQRLQDARVRRRRKSGREPLHHRSRNLCLDGGHLGQIALEGLRPELKSVRRVGELDAHAQRRSRLAERAFDNGVHVQRTRDLAHVTILTLEGECRGPRDHSKARVLRQRIHHIERKTIGKVFVLGSVTQIDER